MTSCNPSVIGMYKLAQACRYLTVNRVYHGPVVSKQASLGLTFHVCTNHEMLNYHYTSRPRDRGIQLCKLSITIMYD